MKLKEWVEQNLDRIRSIIIETVYYKGIDKDALESAIVNVFSGAPEGADIVLSQILSALSKVIDALKEFENTVTGVHFDVAIGGGGYYANAELKVDGTTDVELPDGKVVEVPLLGGRITIGKTDMIVTYKYRLSKPIYVNIFTDVYLNKGRVSEPRYVFIAKTAEINPQVLIERKMSVPDFGVVSDLQKKIEEMEYTEKRKTIDVNEIINEVVEELKESDLIEVKNVSEVKKYTADAFHVDVDAVIDGLGERKIGVTVVNKSPRPSIHIGIVEPKVYADDDDPTYAVAKFISRLLRALEAKQKMKKIEEMLISEIVSPSPKVERKEVPKVRETKPQGQTSLESWFVVLVGLGMLTLALRLRRSF